MEEDYNNRKHMPVEYLVLYDTKDDKNNVLGESGTPRILEEAIPYPPRRHIPSIGMVSYAPANDDEKADLEQVLKNAYENSIIKSYERIEKNIRLTRGEAMSLEDHQD
ncbi:MAG: hypothetical protein ACMXYL_01955 [Candidatus Woesearchaeota archaeon]